MPSLDTPMDFQVRKVQTDTGMDFLQALHHLQGRAIAKARIERERRAAAERAVARFADSERTAALRRMLGELIDVAAPAYDIVCADGELLSHPTLIAARQLMARLDAEDREAVL